MFIFPELRARRFCRPMILLAATSALALSLAACSSDDDVDATAAAGSAFTQALQKDYTDLAHQAESLPPAPSAEEPGFFSSLNPFSDDNDTSGNDLLSKAFTAKANIAAGGSEPEPESTADPVSTTIRARLVRAVAAGKEQAPEVAARAQADFDCWVLYGTVPSAAAASQACKSSLDGSLAQLESVGRPVTPAPAPVATAPIAPPPPAPAANVSSDFTVHFDFDSWTLKAEELTVLTGVINTARTGGQTNITVVGHTDTSGPADYNQKLSVHRANVVKEALIDMGARRAAIHASGVGESDLAVQTGDNIKEAQNRRAVITLQP